MEQRRVLKDFSLSAAVASLWIAASSSMASAATPSAFVDLSRVDPSIVVEMRYAGEHNFVGERIAGYNTAKCLLTEKAARALSAAQQELKPFALSLKVYDCYRPQRAVDRFVAWAKALEDERMKAEFYPHVEKKDLFRDGYIAARSSHSRGSTVDVTIVPVPAPAQGEYHAGQKLISCELPVGERFPDNSLDMGSGFDCFSALSHPGNLSAGVEQRSNRALLRSVMERHGFRGLEQEWWHFTLRDEPFPNRAFDFAIE